MFFELVLIVGAVGVAKSGMFNDITLSVLGVPYSVNPLGVMVYSVFGYVSINKYKNLAIPFFFFSIGYTEIQYNLVHWLVIPNSFYSTVDSPNWFFFLCLWIILIVFGALVSIGKMGDYFGTLIIVACHGIIFYLIFGGFIIQILSGLLTLFCLYYEFEPKK